MKQTYNTGLAANSISFGATVGTVGTAYTSVFLVQAGGATSTIAESNEDSGNIATVTLGQASTLKTATLVVRTSIDFGNIDPSLWPQQLNKLVITYALGGGFSGNASFHQDADDIVASPSGQTLVVTKAIAFQ